MALKDKLNSVLDNTVQASKTLGKMAIDKGKEVIDENLELFEQDQLRKKEIKAEENAIKKQFKPDKRIGVLRVDSKNKLFKIKNASGEAFKPKSGLMKKAFTVSTLGLNKVVENAVSAGDKIYSFNDLIDYELLEDDISIASGGLGRAAVGAVAFGGVGAVVGAVTGKKTTKKKITQLILKINLNDSTMPCVMIPYITSPTKTTSKEYKEAFNEAHQVLSMLALIVEQSKHLDLTPITTTNVQIVQENSLEQIKKLKDLLDIGAITQEEFDLKKKQLLGL